MYEIYKYMIQNRLSYVISENNCDHEMLNIFIIDAKIVSNA